MFYENTMTGTGVDMNRHDNPDGLPHPQSVVAPRSFAAAAQDGAPENLGTTTVTGVDLNRDGLPNVLQQPQIDLATMTVSVMDLNRDGLCDVQQQLQCGLAHQGFAALAQCGAQ